MYKKPLFSELADLLSKQQEETKIFRSKTEKVLTNKDYSQDYKNRTVNALSSEYNSIMQGYYDIATEFVQAAITHFNDENIDTDFLLKCKMLGNAMPDHALKNFLIENKGNFRTMEALHQIYSKDKGKQHIINDYRLKQEKMGMPNRYISIETYLDDLGIAIDNLFKHTHKLPSEMGYRGEISTNQVINLLNAGRISQGDNAIDFIPDNDTTFNFQHVRETPKSE